MKKAMLITYQFLMTTFWRCYLLEHCHQLVCSSVEAALSYVGIVALVIFFVFVTLKWVGLNSHNPTVGGRIEITVQPSHMYKYAYRVVIFLKVIVYNPHFLDWLRENNVVSYNYVGHTNRVWWSYCNLAANRLCKCLYRGECLEADTRPLVEVKANKLL